jgi:glycosidase
VIPSARLAITILLCCASSGLASNLRISVGLAGRASNELEADYGLAHVFIDEVAHESVPVTVFLDPQTLGVESAEVFTNLNRRDRATRDSDGDGIEDGIKPPDANRIPAGDDRSYYKAHPMELVQGGYQVTIRATKCGAYRLTARYRLNGEPPGTYHWYGAELNAAGMHKRDFAIVVSPSKTRSIQLYELNPLSIIATGTLPQQRGNFADLAEGLPAGTGPRFSLRYAKALGVNMLWLMPIHPNGIDGRQGDPANGRPFEIGSPYAVKNYFAVMPLLAKAFHPGGTAQTNDTSGGRAQALVEFQHFVRAADAQGVDIMLDAPYNHTAHDVELGDKGQQYWGNPGSTATSEIRNVESRFFSRAGAYDMRAQGAHNVGPAPDRFDFGKWQDTLDIYFGRYAALVANQGDAGNFRNEGDWFDYSVGDENRSGDGNGHFDGITQKVWRYMGDVLQFWLTQTGYSQNESGDTLDSSAGIDGLRGDFGQGMPPQCWEYIVNRTRARKWNFVFMAESLDGGPITYRSARHFDILNENIIFDIRSRRTATDFRNLYEQRRNIYGESAILLNTATHDEDNYRNPFEALMRFAVNSTMDGVPLILAGQEAGLRGTIVPPNGNSDPQAGPPFGYDRYFSPFDPNKKIPQFMTFNSLMPLWVSLRNPDGDGTHLEQLYSAIGRARNGSKALRGPNRFFLNLQNNTLHEQIFSVAKFERQNASPAESDVVFGFVNLVLNSDPVTPEGNWFAVDIDADHDGANDFGIKPDRLYNVKNMAAYTGLNPTRNEVFLWPGGRTGSDLLRKGIFIHLNRVPSDRQGWANAPYEAQYLKLFDVTPQNGSHL